MRELRELTHSPHHLMVFEASARHQSFTAAARELTVSQPAVSTAIRQLETALGVRLFRRSHRSVTLTEAGEMLYKDVSLGFGRILETARLLHRKTREKHVTLSTSTAFANYWMVPRLSDLHTRHPDIDLRLQTADKDLDLEEEGISLGIRCGDGMWRGYDCELIAEEILFPITSPRLAQTCTSGNDLKALATENLIHLEEPYRPRPTWKDWFSGMGFSFMDDGKGLRLNDYALVIQAAMAGEGIALGWRHIVDPLIEQNLLARVGNWSVQTGSGFYLVWSSKAQLSDQAIAVRAWMIETAADRAGKLTSS
jgi:DNA-binding transcriptional LysR family regulator